jgi:hypothetical protein
LKLIKVDFVDLFALQNSEFPEGAQMKLETKRTQQQLAQSAQHTLEFVPPAQHSLEPQPGKHLLAIGYSSSVPGRDPEAEEYTTESETETSGRQREKDKEIPKETMRDKKRQRKTKKDKERHRERNKEKDDDLD